MNESRLAVGLLVNPLAGLGGALAMKGSDGETLRERVTTLSPEQRARSQGRAERALSPLQPLASQFRLLTCAGDMGEQAANSSGLAAEVVYIAAGEPKLTSADDTRAAAAALIEAGAELLVFVGGDGTARDVFDVVGERFPVLGVPAGVKMHSGVFAVSPEAAGELLVSIVEGGLVGLQTREVRDIDEDAFRSGVVRARFYGEMRVPGEGKYLQQTKIGGRESPELVAAEIAEWLAQTMEEDVTYIMGPGSTTASIMESLQLPNTLLGVDIVRNHALVASDVDESKILEVLTDQHYPARIIVTAIGGQGHVFGRGNQQLSPAVIRKVGPENVLIVAAKSKIAELEGRPLRADTNDPALDNELSGLVSVLTGYDDYILYRLASGAALE